MMKGVKNHWKSSGSVKKALTELVGVEGCQITINKCSASLETLEIVWKHWKVAEGDWTMIRGFQRQIRTGLIEKSGGKHSLFIRDDVQEVFIWKASQRTLKSVQREGGDGEKWLSRKFTIVTHRKPLEGTGGIKRIVHVWRMKINAKEPSKTTYNA